MEVYIGYLLFLNFWIHIESLPECSRNPLFPELTVQPELSLCNSAADEECPIRLLTVGTQYYGCTLGNETKYPFIVIAIQRVKSSYKITKCLRGNVFADFSGCSPGNDQKFMTADLGRYEYYAILCNEIIGQFPSNNEDFVEIIGYDSFKYPNEHLYLFPALTLTCVSYCNESQSYFINNSTSQLVPSLIDPNDKRILRTRLITIKTVYSLMYLCAGGNAKNWSVNFSMISVQRTCIFNERSTDTRCIKGQLRNTFDAGENLYCLVKAFYNKTKYTEGITPFNILYRNSTTVLSKFGVTTLTVEENLPISSKYFIDCYIGDYSYKNSPLNSNSEYFYLLVNTTMNIQARYKTSILYADGKYINDFDIEEDRDIMCNETYYRTYFNPVPVLQIQVFYNPGKTYPLSNYIGASDTVNYTSDKNLISFKYRDGINAFVYCKWNSDKSSPVIVISGDRPVMKIFNEFPKWDLEYTIDGFIYGCEGNFTTYIEFTCQNCSDGIKIESTTFGNKSYIAFSGNIRRDMTIVLACKGFSKVYEPKLVTKVLKLISVSLTRYNDTNSFFMAGDYFNCIAKFQVRENNVTKVIRMQLPTILKINNETFQTTEQERLFELFSTIPNGKFQACCPTSIYRIETCDLTELLVVGSFEVKWNRNLSFVYPANEIMCDVCVQYTEFTHIQPCESRNKIRSTIGIKTIFPDNSVEQTPCTQDKFIVRSPKQRYLPDNITLEPMINYNSRVTCCVKRGYVTKKIGLRSCNEYPTPIILIPKYITLFTVNGSFSCTTDSIECQQGIIYQITVRKSNHEISIIGSSYQFTYKDIGNRVNIICSAGTIDKVSDQRIVRVEQKPFNVTIKGLFRMMWPGLYLTCVSEGFPRPTITWIQTGGKSPLRVSENFLLIGPSDISGSFSVTCEVKNKQGVARQDAAFLIFNPAIPEDDASKLFYALIPIFTIIFLCVIFGSLAIIFQEDVFGAPFFSTHRAVKDMNKTSNLFEILKNLK